MDAAVARTVYVISDLHSGGTYGNTPESRGFRLNTHVAQLAGFVGVLGVAAGQLDRWILFRPSYIQLDFDANDRVVHADLLTYQQAAAAGS